MSISRVNLYILDNGYLINGILYCQAIMQKHKGRKYGSIVVLLVKSYHWHFSICPGDVWCCCCRLDDGCREEEVMGS